jgi:hypothetical protein
MNFGNHSPFSRHAVCESAATALSGHTILAARTGVAACDRVFHATRDLIFQHFLFDAPQPSTDRRDPSTGTIVYSSGRPTVSVPVLSSTTVPTALDDHANLGRPADAARMERATSPHHRAARGERLPTKRWRKTLHQEDHFSGSRRNDGAET